MTGGEEAASEIRKFIKMRAHSGPLYRAEN